MEKTVCDYCGDTADFRLEIITLYSDRSINNDICNKCKKLIYKILDCLRRKNNEKI